MRSLERKNLGITLISLVVTIIILMILAGVSIYLISGSSGILGRATASVDKSNVETAKEQVTLKIEEHQSDFYEGKYVTRKIGNAVEQGDWIYENYDGKTKDYKFTITLPEGKTAADAENPYIVTILKNKGLAGNVTGTLSLDGRLEWDEVIVGSSGSEESNKVTKNVDIFKELLDNNKTVDDLSEYGMTISRSGKNQDAGYNELNNLGMGSGTGVNSNTFTLTIDYNTLVEKTGNQFKGIYAKFYHFVETTRSGNVSWVYSKILVTYDDNTTSGVQTAEDRAENITVEEERTLTAMFDTNKKVSKIQIIIDMLDGNYGHATGAIREMEFLGLETTSSSQITERKDIFKELADNNKTVDDLSEYGMTISRSGKNQDAGYNELNNLGMGSGTGVNSNTFTLTIDYNTLVEKTGSQFKGIYAKFYHFVETTRSGNVSWVYSKILVTYDDNTTSEVQTDEDRAENITVEEERTLTAMFDTNKKVSKIQIIINMLDGNYGHATGAIREMEFLR